jgi:hypothetical protein
MIVAMRVEGIVRSDIPRTLVIWRRLRIICSPEPPRFMQVGDKPQGGAISLSKGITSPNQVMQKGYPYRRSQRTGVANRQHVQIVA